MKQIQHIILSGLLLVLASCRSGPQIIPEKTLRSVMRDLLVSEAVLQTDRAGRSDRLPIDSVDIHTVVLDRYGYTLADLRHTVREYSLRKSNPLANILSEVAEEIKVSRIAVERRYREVLRIDSIARARTADTVFRSDTVLRGKLDGLRFVYTEVVEGDSVVPAGTYRIGFDYSTGSHARSYTKSVRAKRIRQNGLTNESTLWLPTARDTTAYEGEIVVAGDVKAIEIFLAETLRKDLVPDTCYLTGLRLVHVLPASRARALLQQQITGFPEDLESYYNDKRLPTDTTLRHRTGWADDSRPVPPFAGR